MRVKKSLTEQVEDYFRYRQAKVWHKCKKTTDKDSLWKPPRKNIKREEE